MVNAEDAKYILPLKWFFIMLYSIADRSWTGESIATRDLVLANFDKVIFRYIDIAIRMQVSYVLQF